MAGIKYKGTDGQWHLFNNVMVNAINVVQTTGTSTADVMSQSAVTEAVSGVNEVITAHTSDSNIHLTSIEKEQLHTHSNKTALDSITGSVGTMAYEDKASYSSVTEVNAYTAATATEIANKVSTSDFNSYSGRVDTAINSKASQSDLTAHTASTVHMDSTEKTNLDSLATNIVTISGITSTDKLIHETMNRRTRKNFTASGMTYFVNTLKSAIADQSLEKYGMKVGDYYTVTHDGKTYNYVIAGLNTMKGTSTPYRLGVNHVGIIVDTNDTHAWNTGGTTSASTNTHSADGTWTLGTAAAGYASCDLQYYLEHTVLKNVKTDLGSGNIQKHYKLYSTAVNTSGYNRFGSAGGCSSSWAWYENQEICALSEVQVYGSTVWSSSGYDTGEACRQLDVFRVYNMNEIFEGRYPWLRDVASSSYACYVNSSGIATNHTASRAFYVAALILFA